MSMTCITYMELDLTIMYDFEPGEPQTHDDPGCADEAIINQVLLDDVDITATIGSDHLERIAERVAGDHDEDSAAGHVDYLIKQYKENLQ